MTNSEAAARCLDIKSLSIFSALRSNPLIDALLRLFVTLSTAEGTIALTETIAAWANFSAQLAARGGSLRLAIAKMAAMDENTFTFAAERNASDDEPLATLARSDLARLGRIAAQSLDEISSVIARNLRDACFHDAAQDIERESAAFVAADKSVSVELKQCHPAGRLLFEARDWAAAFPAFSAAIMKAGAGKLGTHGAFVWEDGEDQRRSINHRLRAVRNPDSVALRDLSGYEDQRAIVVSNTRRLLDGKSANNLLLYGDRGTGKSATVKAVCNEYLERGLRLVEVRKTQLPRFAEILETLAARSARFVIFVDDLSFEKTDDAYTGLKALLEGGAEARPENVVVYATSNRRHLVVERLSDRPTTAAVALAAETGDVRAFDSMQEQLSLADRFGVTVVFAAPTQDEYLRIAEFIAEKRGLLKRSETPEVLKRFRDDALRWERWFNGRSPRTARQYVDWLEGGGGFPWE